MRADAFCHNMVRSLIGALLFVGDGHRAPDWPGKVLAAGVRDSAVHVVRPHGLTLEEVGYPADELLAARSKEARNKRSLPGAAGLLLTRLSVGGRGQLPAAADAWASPRRRIWLERELRQVVAGLERRRVLASSRPCRW